MPKKNEVYKCMHCGNIVEFLVGNPPPVSCCGEPMKHMEENTVEAATEKHVPVVEITPEGIKVSVGSVEHPMVEKHYIEWIELITDKGVCRAELNPGEKPEKLFPMKPDNFRVRAYCNLHGLWKGE